MDKEIKKADVEVIKEKAVVAKKSNKQIVEKMLIDMVNMITVDPRISRSTMLTENIKCKEAMLKNTVPAILKLVE